MNPLQALLGRGESQDADRRRELHDRQGEDIPRAGRDAGLQGVGQHGEDEGAEGHQGPQDRGQAGEESQQCPGPVDLEDRYLIFILASKKSCAESGIVKSGNPLVVDSCYTLLLELSTALET